MTTEATRRDHLEVGRDPADRPAFEEAIAVGHELDSVRSDLLRKAAAVFVGLVVIGVAIAYLVQPLFTGMQRAEYPPPNPLAKTYGRSEPPAPRLQVDPKRDIYEHRLAEERLLTTYGWVDREAGVVRIPIERAMDLLLERAPRPGPRPEGRAGVAIEARPQPGARGQGQGAQPAPPAQPAPEPEREDATPPAEQHPGGHP